MLPSKPSVPRRCPPLRRVIALLALGFFAQTSTGCLSHEHHISRNELMRLAQLPPETRGAQVHVVQDLGSRRGDAVEPPPPPPPPDEGGPGGSWNAQIDLHFSGNGYGHGGGRGPSSYGGPSSVHAPAVSASGPSGGSVGAVRAPAVAASGSGGASPAGGAPTAARPSGGGGGGFNLSGGGGGGGGNDGLVVLAVVVVAVAVFAAAGLAVTEGMRYDGDVAIAPGQILHLETSSGHQEVPLGALTLDTAARASEAVVCDDEGWGLLRLGRAPLDRKGFAFKVDLGGMQTLLDDYNVGGLASNIQIGYFPHRRFGLLGGLSLTGGVDPRGESFAKHSLSLEAQAFPVHLGPLHLGLAAHGGRMLVADAAGTSGEPAFGAAALLELELTTRLALTVRGDWTESSRAGGGWTPVRALSGGIAIY
jgi:hypothetical protein